MADMNAMRNHPGFLAFKASNPKPVNVEDTQAGDALEAKLEVKEDSKVSGGGEESKG